MFSYFLKTLKTISAYLLFNSLPKDKILDWSKLKVLADDKINVDLKLKFDWKRVENIEGEGENAGHRHFLHIP